MSEFNFGLDGDAMEEQHEADLKSCQFLYLYGEY